MKSVTLNQLRWSSLPARLFSTILLSSVFVFSTRHTIAQSYYPGGLGNANLIIWLNAANSGSITQSGGTVSLWGDLSGHAYNFAQGTTSRQPAYTATGGPGSRPALSFNAAGTNYLSRSSMAASLSYTGGISSFATASFNASATGKGFERIYDFGNGQASDNIWMGRFTTTANISYEVRNGAAIAQTYTTTNALVNGSNNIQEIIQQGGTVASFSNVTFYQGGALQASSGSSGSTSYVPNTLARTVDYIGRSNWAADDYFSGTMSEIMFYNTAMNNTQRIILENYLWAAWTLPVSATYYTPPTTTTYYKNLVGIGYTSATDYFLADISGSTDGLGFSSTSGATGFLNTAGYVMAAHNQQANTINSSVTITGIGSNLNMWNRSWNVQKTGGNSSGYITVNFNFSDYNGTTPNATYSYGLLYNATDGSFATGTNKLIALSGNSTAGNIVSLTAKASNLSAGYYTLVWSTSAALPITLTAFFAAPVAGTSLLQWNVSTGGEPGYFEVQRAADATHFVAMATVTATANNQYSFTDQQPAPGLNYYRLKITGEGGTAAYSPVCIIDFGTGLTPSLSIYPDPVTDILHISGAAAGQNITVRIRNTEGQLVKIVQQTASGVMDIPVSALPKGIYIANISAGKTFSTLKFAKE